MGNVNWQMVTAISGIVFVVVGAFTTLLAVIFKRSEKTILDKISTLEGDIARISSYREHDTGRLHKLELDFAGIGTALAEFRADMAERYVGRPHFDRVREQITTDIARIQTLCFRKHGEFPTPGDSGPNPKAT